MVKQLAVVQAMLLLFRGIDIEDSNKWINAVLGRPYPESAILQGIVRPPILLALASAAISTAQVHWRISKKVRQKNGRG